MVEGDYQEIPGEVTPESPQDEFASVGSAPRLGSLLIHYREHICRLTQNELAHRSGVNQATISLAENGRAAQKRTLESLARVFAEYATWQSYEQIIDALMDARAEKPALPMSVPGMDEINLTLQPFPVWFQAMAVRAMRDLVNALAEVYKARG